MQKPEPDPDVLECWKEISAYLNHDIRTVQRWERERGLPVRRIPGGEKPRVYAVKSELNAWRRTRGIHLGPTQGSDETVAPPESVAVLPFLNLSASVEDQYFGDGLADEVITALSSVLGLRVTARTSSFAFRGREHDIREIGRRLNAQAVLEGSVRRSGSRIRVTAQLIGAKQGYLLWSARFDRELTDLFSIQDEITRAIVAALRVRLTHSVPRVVSPTGNQEAYHLWLRARYHTQRQTPDEILRSRELFAQAIVLDPAFARAHLGLAESSWEGAIIGLLCPRDAVAIGRQSVLKALEIDDTLGEAHAMLGIYRGVHDFDWEAAERAFRCARELSPASPEVRRRYAAFLLEPTMRLDEAHAELDWALELDPLSPVVHTYLAHHLIYRRDFQQAAKELRLAVDLDPSYWLAHLMLGGTYLFRGEFESAIAICEKVLEACGPNPHLLGATALVSGLLANRQRVEGIRRQLIDLSCLSYDFKLAHAWTHLGLGENEACLDWLEKAVNEREPLIVEFQPKPLYDAIRDHPRFQALLSTMHLANAG